MDTKIEREILRGKRYINEHPIVAYSPGDLTRSGSSIESFSTVAFRKDKDMAGVLRG